MQLRDERKLLEKEANELRPKSRPSLDLLRPSDTRLEKIEEGRKELETFKDELERIEKDENDPVRKELLTKLEAARVMEGGRRTWTRPSRSSRA